MLTVLVLAVVVVLPVIDSMNENDFMCGCSGPTNQTRMISNIFFVTTELISVSSGFIPIIPCHRRGENWA